MKEWIVASILSLVVTAIYTGGDEVKLSAREADPPFPGWRSNIHTSPRNLQARHPTTVRRWINDIDSPPTLHRRKPPPQGKPRAKSPPKITRVTPYAKPKVESQGSGSLRFSPPRMPDPVSAHADKQKNDMKRRTWRGKLSSPSKSGDLKDVQLPEAEKSLDAPAGS